MKSNNLDKQVHAMVTASVTVINNIQCVMVIIIRKVMEMWLSDRRSDDPTTYHVAATSSMPQENSPWIELVSP